MDTHLHTHTHTVTSYLGMNTGVCLSLPYLGQKKALESPLEFSVSNL